MSDHHDDISEREAHTCALLRRADGAHDPERSSLRDEAIELNLPLADSLARRYRDRGAELEDLVQVARVGLVNAVERFDPRRGDFTVYAVPTIAGELKRHFRDHAWSVRPPRRIQELQADLSASWSPCAQRLGRTPRVSDLADELGRDVREVRDAMAARGCFHSDSLDAPSPATGTRLQDRMGRTDAEFAHAELLAVLIPACRELPPQDRELLRLRFVEQLSQTEVARRLGTNQMAISRRQRKILRTLARRLVDAAPSADDGPLAA